MFIIDKQKGVSLIVTFFIMMIFLAIVLSISILLYSEVKVVRNIGNSMAGLYAADSGIEKILYYDRQVSATTTPCSLASPCLSGYTCKNGFCNVPRGLCLIFSSSLDPASYCQPSGTRDSSVYCVNPTMGSGNGSGMDCVPASCTNCAVTFNTTFDNRNYYVTATIVSPNYTIDSKGAFGSAGREIQILIAAQ
jgi:hypothetical protein